MGDDEEKAWTEREREKDAEEEKRWEDLDMLIMVLASKTNSVEEKINACERLCEVAAASSSQTIETFRRCGGFSALNSLLKSSDETLVDAAASALGNLSSTSTRKPTLRSFKCGDHVVKCRELEFSASGTAFNAWTAGLVLATWMAKSERFAGWAKGARILEIGSGLGTCGLLAAKLGGNVTLSDFVPAVLQNLQLNALENEVHARVVRLDWAAEAGLQAQDTSNTHWYAGAVAEGEVSGFESLREEEVFDLIIGSDVCYETGQRSDVCYETDHPELVSAVLAKRLAPGGWAAVLNAVRFPELHDSFLQKIAKFCNSVETEAVDSEEGILSVDIVQEGCTQHSGYYAGGMQLILAQRSEEGGGASQ